MPGNRSAVGFDHGALCKATDFIEEAIVAKEGLELSTCGFDSDFSEIVPRSSAV